MSISSLVLPAVSRMALAFSWQCHSLLGDEARDIPGSRHGTAPKRPPIEFGLLRVVPVTLSVSRRMCRARGPTCGVPP